VSQHPGETAEQSLLRASSDYQDAWNALGAVSILLPSAGWRFPASSYPLLDDAYGGAANALDDADNERQRR